MKKNVLESLNDFRIKHEPEILMGFGIAGLCFSVVWGIKATVKAVRVCDEKRANENKEKLSAKDVIKATWKLYLPVLASTAVSVPCIIAGNRVSSKRTAALAAAYTISETALKEFQNKTEEIVGEKKVKQIEEAVAQEKVEKAQATSKEIILNDDSEQLFFEPYSGRFFKSTWNKLEAAVNELNEEALGSTTGVYSLNDWYEKIGLDWTDAGEVLGWATPGYDNSQGLLKISMDTTKTKDNKPCGAIHYDVRAYPIR